MRIRYYTAGRDAVSQRTVDPMRLLIADGRSYLEAWCRRAEAVRLFRLDRVDDVVLLDEPAAPPPDAVPTDVSEGAFRARAGARLLEPPELAEVVGERARAALAGGGGAG